MCHRHPVPAASSVALAMIGSMALTVHFHDIAVGLGAFCLTGAILIAVASDR